MNPAILVVSFGTTHLDTLQDNIARTEADIAAAFPGSSLYRAFTSKVVRFRLKKNLGIHVDSVEEAMARIAADGHTHVVVQPTLLIPGEEYDRLYAWVKEAAGPLHVSIGRPLLGGESDLDAITAILREAYPTAEDTVLLTMGHGTEHNANDLYERLTEKFRAQDGAPMRLCTVEGKPSFADAVQELAALPQRKVLLVPLLFVAGEHAKEDMAGEGPKSLHSMLTAAGFHVSCVVRGLGQLQSVRDLYVQRALEEARVFSGYAAQGSEKLSC